MNRPRSFKNIRCNYLSICLVAALSCVIIQADCAIVGPQKSPSQTASDNARMITELRNCAEHGDNNCRYQLGMIYLYSDSKNYEGAIRYLTLAAQDKHPNAQAELGVCFQNGTGVPVNPEEAVRLWQAAAEAGSARGYEWLGIHSFSGYGPLPKDRAQGRVYLTRAIKLGRSDLGPILEALDKAEPGIR